MQEQYTPQDIHDWKFASELSEYTLPVFPDKNAAQLILIRKAFPDKNGVLETAYESLTRYFAAAGYRVTSDEKKADLQIAETVNPDFFPEQYSISIHSPQVEIEAAEPEGIRRGIYALIDILCENSGKLPDVLQITRKPWLKTRLSRSPFSPIKRWPVYTDELLDDQDYYPDALLERFAHDAVNGIWIVSELRELSETSFRKTDPRKELRLRKLKQLVQKCHRFGIRVYLFMIEPFGVLQDDELLKEHPEMFGPPAWGGKTCYCPAEANTRQYLFDSFRSIFTAVPQLGGVINICLGERPTTCLSSVRTCEQRLVECQAECGLDTGAIMERNLRAMSDGMKAAAPDARLIAWFYLPETESLAPWVTAAASKIPAGVIPQFNFESAAVKIQLDKPRRAGDYWVSCIGPSPRFRKAARKNSVKDLGAKLQLSCGHEFTVVPYIPAPGIAYRKYRAMHQMGVNHVMQSWYIGNFPGLLSKAMGLLAFEDFQENEESFLIRLARQEWQSDWRPAAKAWKKFYAAYQKFPFSLLFQYYGPQNSCVNWKFHFLPELYPLTPPWKPNFPASGDAIGECLGRFELEEVLTLLAKLCSSWRQGCRLLEPLYRKYSNNREHLRDLNIAKAAGILFYGTWNLFRFYQLRHRLYSGDRSCLEPMIDCVKAQQKLFRELIPLLESDSRLGFHGEALIRIFDENKTRQAIADADIALHEAEQLRQSPLPPLRYAQECGVLQMIPEHRENSMPGASWSYSATDDGLRIFVTPAQGFVIKGMEFYFIDLCGTRYPLYEMFEISGGQISGRGNLYRAVTGKKRSSGVRVGCLDGSYCFFWPRCGLPMADGDTVIRFSFALISDHGMIPATGKILPGRLLMGAISPHDTVCLELHGSSQRQMNSRLVQG